MDKHSSLHVGMRNLKTSITVAVCAPVYYFLDRSPALACIGGLIGGHAAGTVGELAAAP